MGLISVTNIADGTVIDANDVNSPINTIVDAINGNISEANLANSAVTTSKIATGAVATANIANAAVTPPKWHNPYKFSAYIGTSQNMGTTTWDKLNFDVKSYDTNNNFSTSTKGYTAPVNGYYHFDLSVLFFAQAGAPFLIGIGKNTTTPETYRLGEIPNCTGNTTMSGGLDVYLLAGDVIYALGYSSAAGKVAPTSSSLQYNRFSGHLISET